jgi:hypothetical protein
MTVTGGASPVVRCRTLLVVRVGQRARIGGGTDGSARIGSAILYGVRAVTAWNLKPMGHCSIANGSAATAWPGLARTHAHDSTSTHAQAHTHARTRTHTQDKGAGLSAGGGSARAHTPRRAQHSDCPVATNATQRWHQTKVPESWTNWTSHCSVFRATLAVHRHVQRRARIGGGRSPRSEPGPTRTATRAADRSSCRRRSQQCEWRASRCSAPQWPPQPAAATTRGSANHPRASTDPCLLDPSVRPFHSNRPI